MRVKVYNNIVRQRLLCMLCLFALLLSACHNDDEKEQPSAPESTANIAIGDTVPSFILEGVDGDVKSSSLKGQVFTLTFFDTGCPDCKNEFPILQQIYEKYKDVVPMFHVPRSQPVSEVRAYWEQEGLVLPVYTAPGLYYKFAQRTIPRTYVVDRNGVVRAIYTDSPIADFQTLDSILTRLLEENLSVKAGPSLNIKAGYGQGVVGFSWPYINHGSYCSEDCI